MPGRGNSGANFAAAVLSSIGGVKDAQAHIAFYFGAMYVLQIVEQVLAEKLAEGAALVLSMLNVERDGFVKAQALADQ